MKGLKNNKKNKNSFAFWYFVSVIIVNVLSG